MSEYKVRIKESYCSVDMVYNPKGLLEVSTAGPLVDVVLQIYVWFVASS